MDITIRGKTEELTEFLAELSICKKMPVQEANNEQAKQNRLEVNFAKTFREALEEARNTIIQREANRDMPQASEETNSQNV